MPRKFGTPQNARRPDDRESKREARGTTWPEPLDEMGRIHQKAWELLARAESEGDHRGAIIALREVPDLKLIASEP